MAYNLAKIIHLLFLTYTILLFVRIIGSWFPTWQRTQLFRFVAFYVDPYLNIFRKFLPPLGGVLDLSPILAFFTLRILEIGLLALIK